MSTPRQPPRGSGDGKPVPGSDGRPPARSPRPARTSQPPRPRRADGQPRPARPKAAQPKPAQPKSAQPKSAQPRPAGSKPSAAKPAAAKPAPARSAQPRVQSRLRSGPAGPGPRPRPRPAARSQPRTIKLADPRKRLRFVTVVLSLVFSVFAGRLVQLQLIDSDALAADANTNRYQVIPLTAERGSITSSDGVALATTVDAYDITADPQMFTPGRPASRTPPSRRPRCWRRSSACPRNS